MGDVKSEIKISSAQFEKIVGLLRGWNRFDLHAYKEQTILRRLSRRVFMVGCKTVDEYLEYLEKTPTEIDSLFNDLLIEVTSFFRDKEAFESLKVRVIELLAKKDVPEIRVWVPACATGQEAYSVGIFISEALKECGRTIPYRIFATDLSEEAVAFSSAGIYSPEMLEGVSEALLKEYFYQIDDNRFRVHPRLRSRISFFKHNIIADPPFPYIDLICCRNLLIYFKPEFQQQIICTFHFSLRHEGFLFLGSSESLNSLNHGFHNIDNRWRIYQKNSEVRLPFEAHRLKPEPIAIDKFGLNLRSSTGNAKSRLVDVYDSLMALCGSPGILLDARHEILHINGEVMKYFPPVRGRLTSRLLEWADGELKISLSSALARAEEFGKIVRINEIPVVTTSFAGTLEVSVTPFKTSSDSYFFVQVSEAVEQCDAKVECFRFNLDIEAQNRIERLEIEVKELQNGLYCALEEKKSSQEELQASNEELRASNEELQSSNEELQAITSEHEDKIRELISLNNDIRNLLVSTDIAAVFLDEDLRIRRYTPVAETLLGLSPKDVDHMIGTIRSELIDGKTIEKDAVLTLEKGYPVESELKTRDGRSFFCRLLPYRNESGDVRGLVLTFTDTTSLRAAESAFLESEVKFQTAVEAVNDVVWSYDVSDDKFEFSDRWLKIVGKSFSQKVLSLGGFADFLHQDDKEKVVREFKKAMEGRNTFGSEFRVISPDESGWKWVMSRGRAIEFDFKGNATRMLGTLSDVSHRKQLEVEQAQKQSLLSLLCDGIGLGFWVLDLNTSQIMVDKVFGSIVGISEELISSEELVRLCVDEDRQTMESSLADIIVGVSHSVILEFRVNKGDEQLWVKLSGIVSERMADGSPRKVIGFIENINERKKAERDLKQYSAEIRQQKETLENLVENMPIAVLAKRPADNFRYFLCNPAAEKLLQKSRDEIIGCDLSGLLGEKESARFDEFDLKMVASPEVMNIGEQTVMVGNRERVVKITRIPVLGNNLEVDSIFVLIEDVTEERSLGAQLQHSQKMDAVGRLAGGIAHDFNNMLQAILGYGSLLGDELENHPSAVENLSLVLKAADQASSLVRQLMAFSRKEEIVKRQINVVNTVRDIAKMINRLIGDHIKIISDFRVDEAWVMVDPVQIEQAMVNLCLNSKDAMPSGGELKLSLEIVSFSMEDKATNPDCVPGEYALIRVSDSGRGIAQEHLEHIFEPFFTTKDMGKGTGLGLATVYAIVTQHGGFITVRSGVEQGTEFSMFLPIIEKVDGVEDVFLHVKETTANGETVLLAEDQEMVRDFAARILKKAGYNVVLAADGNEAVEVFKAHQGEIDILVFDVMMPYMNGRQAYEEIERMSPGIPVLFCSGYGDDLLKSEYMVEIEGRLLSKPYRSGDLLREIKVLLSRHRGAD